MTGDGAVTINDVFLGAAERWPDREAVVGDGERWTFTDRRDRAGEVGRSLISLGVERFYVTTVSGLGGVAGVSHGWLPPPVGRRCPT